MFACRTIGGVSAHSRTLLFDVVQLFLPQHQVKYSNVKRGAHDSGGHEADRGGAGTGDGRDSPSMTEVPKIYRKVAIKLSKLGSDDFDFDRYNR